MKRAGRVLRGLLWLALCGSAVAHAQTRGAPLPAQPAAGPLPTDQWAAQLAPGQDPRALAASLGAAWLGPVGGLPDTHLFRLGGSGKPGSRSLALPGVRWSAAQQARRRYPRWSPPADPLFHQQWHLLNLGQSGGAAGMDAGVRAAWEAGLSGQGVVVGIVDDGLAYGHPDLAPNYRAAASRDFNDLDADPAPGALDDHGTAAAGVAAARDDGSRCGVGVAYRASLAGLRLIAAPVTDADEANALSYLRDTIHVFNNSWGPADDGQTLEGPGPLTEAVLADNAAHGRSGLGSLYVWAAGNGNGALDNVNYDGYANSRYTIAVGAVDHNGVQSGYSEPGAAMLITAPSSGDVVGITTTDRVGAEGYNSAAGPDGDCAVDFGGTSAAAPLVSGVLALMLEANPALGWRDVQYILAATARRNDPGDPGWSTNGAGYAVNHKYGFGLVDAAAAVQAARNWVPVPPASTWDSGVLAVNRPIPDGLGPGLGGAPLLETVSVDSDRVLEHVEVVFSASHPLRGDLEVVLVSPAGTESVLAALHDDFNADYTDWRFMSVRHWGEPARGTWILRVTDRYDAEVGRLDRWRLVLHGVGQVAAPSVAPAPGAYAQPIQVALASATAGSVLRYTTDGSDPDTHAAVYTGPIPVAAGQTLALRARAWRDGMSASEPVLGTWTVAAAGTGTATGNSGATIAPAGGGGAMEAGLLAALMLLAGLGRWWARGGLRRARAVALASV